MSYYVYMLRCRDGTLYTGLTNDVVHRMRCHAGLLAGGARYTRSHPPQELAALWRVASKSEAAGMECAIKRLSRQEKEQLLAAPEKMRGTYLPGVTWQACLEGRFHDAV